MRSKNEESEAGMSRTSMVAVGDIQKRIYTLRGLQVMLDEELTVLSSVESRALNKTIKRSIERFPSEFMFQLNDSDIEMNWSQFVTTGNDVLRSQIATLKTDKGQHHKYQPLFYRAGG